jgi:release factor glutamine methyltransferase
VKTIRDALWHASERIPRLEAELLLSYSIGMSRETLWAWPEREITSEHHENFMAHVERRVFGEPIAYIIGERDFWDMRLRVTKDTLIPRPETELLVEKILEIDAKKMTLLDMGTGTGAIALAIARERPMWSITAADISSKALAVARDNAKKYSVNNIEFVESNLFSSLNQRFDIIVSNPPYIKEEDEHLSQGDLRFEPISALVSGCDGLDMIKRLIHEAPAFLNSSGVLVLEHGYHQAEQVRGLLEQSGYLSIETFQDLAGIDRMTFAIRKK